MNMLMGVIPQIINCEQAGMLQFATTQTGVSNAFLTRTMRVRAETKSSVFEEVRGTNVLSHAFSYMG